MISVGECALWVLFAPNCISQVPHLRQANCGLARLLGTKIPPQNPLAVLGYNVNSPKAHRAYGTYKAYRRLRTVKTLKTYNNFQFSIFNSWVLNPNILRY